ncbi:hypothetical protein BBD42_24750 [Paenibacillus sp. BIHB 4019]|uniref:HD-GYP domain-containing protein n=1 Tax=Paenibacillus sp. BIHB 4019 TaxID=1870819 RepID=A0A1B2DNQ2_9BACL|nr:HD domain-containing phosphohydrolase [Paenibacillus sp. BIHB 4019]ANY69334.1 hypothetical protein BBD42_24750 [Paenibacillus sp. BIHB 4019]
MSDTNVGRLLGRRLLHHIFDAGGTLLITKGAVLDEFHLEKLERFRVQIEDIRTENIAQEDFIPEVAEREVAPSLTPEHHSMNLQDMVKRTELLMHEIDRSVIENSKISVESIEDKMLPLIKEVTKRHNLFQLLNDLKEHGDYRYKQTIGTSVIATALGKRLQLDDAELDMLIVAASLYDIGSLQLPSYLVNKTSQLDIHERAIMKQHTYLGYELLKQSGVDERIALVALQHHEREDGSGYPNGLRGDQIDRLSKIVALADVYVAMISDRPYRPAAAFFEVMEVIHRQIIEKRFDSVIGMTFLDSLLAVQVGCEVRLSNDSIGRIVLTNVNYPARPFVALPDNTFIDLSQHPDLSIKEVIG